MRATTLAEVLIASSIALTVAGVAALLLLSYARLAEGTMLQERINGDAQRAMRLLDLQVKSAVAIREEGRTGVVILEQPDGSEPRWGIQNGRLVYTADSGRGRPDPAVIMMEGLAASSRLQVARGDSPAGRRMVDVQLHLVDDADRDGLQVLTLNTRLASRIEPVVGDSFRFATARAAAVRQREQLSGEIALPPSGDLSDSVDE